MHSELPHSNFIRSLLIASMVLTHAFSNHAFAQDTDSLNRPYQIMIEAYSKMDLNLMKKVYTDSAYYLSPGNRQLIRKGAHNFLSDFQYMFEKNKNEGHKLSIAFKIIHRDQSRNSAVDVGYYQLTVKQQNGIDRTSFGKFITQLKKDPINEEWKIAIDGFSNAPPVPFIQKEGSSSFIIE